MYEKKIKVMAYRVEKALTRFAEVLRHYEELKN